MTEIAFRLAVLTQLTAWVEGVTPANGYVHDLTDSVFRGRLRYGENDPIPMVSFVEDPQSKVTVEAIRGSEVAVFPWPLLVQGFVDDDPANPTDPAYALMTDVRKRLSELRKAQRDIPGQNILGFNEKGQRINDLTLGAPIVRPPDEVSVKAYFWLPLTLSLTENPASPFTST